jgi:tetratricopeptide (TPR) repeat protein
MFYTLIVLILITGKTAPQTAEVSARFNHAVELQRRGALEEAATEYRALLNANPEYVEALANLGAVLSRLGQYDESVKAYQRALSLAPDATTILFNLGIAHHRAGQFERAVDVFEKVLARSGDAVQARQLLGISLVELGRDSEALPHLERSLEVSPDDSAVLYSAGLAYLRLRLPQLESTIERLERAAGGKAASHLLRGQMLLARDQFQDSLDELREAAALNSELPRLQYSLGLAMLKVGRNKEAINAFEKELSKHPSDFSSRYYLAYLHELDGDLDSALKGVEAALKLEAQSPEANALLGKILIKRNKPAEAIGPLENAVRADPLDPGKRYLLARAYRQMGRQEDSSREFAEAERLKAEELKRDRARIAKP